jgi:hypothetical protein
LYFNFFSSSFCTAFLSAGIATSICVHVFSFLFLIVISGLFAVTSLSVCIIIIIIIIMNSAFTLKTGIQHPPKAGLFAASVTTTHRVSTKYGWPHL